MDVYHMIYNCQAWHGKRRKMFIVCRKERRSTLVTVKQLFRFRKATTAVLVFISSTRAGRHQEEEEKEEETDEKDKECRLDGEHIEGDDKKGE